MRTQQQKNLISTSFTLDLSTIDKKVNKLVKYLKNCSIDLKDDGKKFINPQQSYETIVKSLDARKYKESLSRLVNDIYLERFLTTKLNLTAQGVITISDLILPEPIDDFGSKFDPFAATNTDPNNAILQLLSVKPYKELKVDIFDEEEIKTYLGLVSSASYDYGNMNFFLTKLDSLTNSYVDLDLKPNYSIDLENYIKEVKEKIFYVKNKISGSTGETEELIYSLPEKIPDLKNAQELMDIFASSTNSQKQLFPTGVLEISSRYQAEEVKSAIGEIIYNDWLSNTDKTYDFKIIDQTRIKLLDFIIRKEIMNALKERINSITFLNDFKSKYTNYDFLEEKIYSGSESKKIKKENLFFRLTYLRAPDELILENKKELISPLNVEFINKQFLKFESPYGSMDTSSKFVAIIGGSDITKAEYSFDFFNPTILSILSDIDYLDTTIYEIDPFYCPTPQSLQPNTHIEKEKYNDNNVLLESSPFSKNKFLVNANPKTFNFINFPNLYFLPNIYPDAISFYEKIKQSLSRDKVERLILDNSKYFYQSSEDTPSSKIIRDSNSNELFRKTLLKNGFYGANEARKDSFADSISLQNLINKLGGVTVKQGIESLNQLQDIIFARTNISCLLKEFQTCFLPKIGSCKDVLRGFRFSELENILTKVFPESAYTEFYAAFMQFKINNIKDEREKKLLEELKELEEAIKNNERKRIVFQELDKRTEPGKALDIADNSISVDSNAGQSLEEQYASKLKQYRDLKLGQQSEQLSALDKSQARKQMNPDELKMIDDFLDLMEKYGLNVDILCSLADLFNITPMMFNFIQLPKFPTIDLFQEVKLSLDLTIIQIIFDSIVAFILKILNELLTCGGIKGLINAAFTGEAEGSITGAAYAALNQIARGDFDLDDFVKSNPQVDPVSYYNSFANIAKTVNPPLTIAVTSSININQDLGILGNINLSAKSKTAQILGITNSSPETELEIKNSLTGLIAELSNIMKPDSFMRTISGNALEQDLKTAKDHIRRQHPEMSYLLLPGALSGIFSYLAEASGLQAVRDEMVAMASFYSSNDTNPNNISCLIPGGAFLPRDDAEQDVSVSSSDASSEEIESDSDTYRNVIQDMLFCSPDSLKSNLDDKIFKPLLMGKLPGGKNISAVEKATSQIIDINFKVIESKFKNSCNDLYSNLVVKKPVKRSVAKLLKQEEGDGEYENPEYKDLVNKGGYQNSDEAGDSLEIEEQKFVYGALFTDNFEKSSKNLSLVSTPQSLKISLTGSTGYTNFVESQFRLTTFNDSCWKIESVIADNENNIIFYEGNVQKQDKIKFKFKVDNQNIDTNLINQDILNTKEEFKNILTDNIINSLNFGNSAYEAALLKRTFKQNFSEYSSNSYDEFLSSIYRKITQTISEDGLLKPINLDSLQKEKYITGIKDGLDSVFPGLSLAIQNNSIPPMISPNIDTPLKYINFCPKPTKQQKSLKIDPGLFGKSELKQFISQIIDKRKNDIIDTKTLEQMLADDDNYLKFAIIDGLYMSLIRTACTEICMRTLFPLRVFKYNKKLVEDLMLPTYVAEMIYNEIIFKANSLKKDSLMQLTQKNISYIHDFIFSEEIDKSENNKLFKELKKLKKEILSLKEDLQIMNSYLGKLRTKITFTEQDKEYKKKINNYISCLNYEIEQKYNKILILELRNIAYNEFIVIFDKLSYITSTNDKVKEGLDEKCRDTEQDLNDKNFLSILISDLLIKSELRQITTETRTVENFIKHQESKFVDGINLIIEHYVDVPPIKGDRNDPNRYSLCLKQNELKCHGPTTFGQFETLLEYFPKDNTPLDSYFEGTLTYGMRVVFVPDTTLKEESSIVFEPNLSNAMIQNFQNLIDEGKNNLKINDNSYTFKNADAINAGIIYSPGQINRHEKTYAIPFVGPQYLDQNKETKRKFGVINAFPIIKETENISAAQVITVSDMLDLIPTLQRGESNKLTDLLKTKISCSEQMKRFYSIFTNENLLSNLTLFSSMGILSSDNIVSPFRTIRKEIINNIYIKMLTIYNNDDMADIMERMSTVEFFKEFNAPLIAKSAIKAAVYVLMYYCQMTDPNISFALILRNAVKLSLSLASQISGPLGGPPIPSELPLALSPLAIYSMAQLPITVFGVPPVGIGVGPPLTIPGMVLLGADLLLLALEFSENLDLNIENDNIKEELRKYCFDLSGYKKYGV